MVISGGTARPQHIARFTGFSAAGEPSSAAAIQRAVEKQAVGTLLPTKEELSHEWPDQAVINLYYIVNLEVFPLSGAWLWESEETVGVRGCNLGGNMVVNEELEAKTTFAQLTCIVKIR